MMKATVASCVRANQPEREKRARDRVRKERSATTKERKRNKWTLWGRRERAYVEPDEGGTGGDCSHAAAIDDAQDKVQRGQTEQDEREYPKLDKPSQ
jgi:hypothetical protein